jgi:hypothetical protein
LENPKKERPCGVCLRCGKVWYHDERAAVGALHQCDPAKPEKGAISIRETAERWMDCWSCNGSGLREGTRCPACHGVGSHPATR